MSVEVGSPSQCLLCNAINKEGSIICCAASGELGSLWHRSRHGNNCNLYKSHVTTAVWRRSEESSTVKLPGGRVKR